MIVHQHLRERVGRPFEGSAKAAQEAKTCVPDSRGCGGGPEFRMIGATVLTMQYLIEIPIKEAKSVPPKWVKISQYV